MWAVEVEKSRRIPEKPLEQENLAEYLSAHPAPMTLADLKAYFTDKIPRRE